MELKAASKCEIVNLVGCRLDGGELWVPQQKEIGSCKVMLLSKWDRGLTKFLTGKSLDFKKDKKTLNSTSAGAYLDALCDLRKKASLKAVQDAHANASDDEEPQPSSKRPRRASNDMAHFQPLVEIMLPGVGDMEPKLVKDLEAWGSWTADEQMRYVAKAFEEFEAAETASRKEAEHVAAPVPAVPAETHPVASSSAAARPNKMKPELRSFPVQRSVPAYRGSHYGGFPEPAEPLHPPPGDWRDPAPHGGDRKPDAPLPPPAGPPPAEAPPAPGARPSAASWLTPMDHWQWNWDAGWDQSGWGSSWWSSQDWQQGYETEVTRPRSPERPPTQGASGKRGHYVKGGFVTEDDGVFRPYGKGRERPRNRAGRQVANERAMRDAISGLAALSQVQLLTVQGKAYGKGKFQ
ncbi:Uncharacterized protein SCF082_LOCUS19255 [Durusdinium trenchii]|uniref:Uncharacterized protein n=1 Tax=Durusdinium trenchii TaxID=1381693 RepID=A0ABP0KUJ9_9DINO